LISAVSACSPTPLPEEGSAAATTYVRNCGGCHMVYRPELMTAAMWRTMVDRMEREMVRRGRSLDAASKEEILAYLARNAGTR
jgi:hypothetical protein